ncbi:MAG: hypothetical protein ACE5H4_10735 [Candidatus Thorarchaeota archaeon]
MKQRKRRVLLASRELSEAVQMKRDTHVFTVLILVGVTVIFIIGGYYAGAGLPWTYYLTILAAAGVLTIGVVGTSLLKRQTTDSGTALSTDGTQNLVDRKIITLAVVGCTMGYVAVSSLICTTLDMFSAFLFWWIYLPVSGVIFACHILPILRSLLQRTV